jgi:hypothetical protein
MRFLPGNLLAAFTLYRVAIDTPGCCDTEREFVPRRRREVELPQKRHRIGRLHIEWLQLVAVQGDRSGVPIEVRDFALVRTAPLDRELARLQSRVK